MGQGQSGSSSSTGKGSLAAFYAQNGADINRELVHMAGPEYKQKLLAMLGCGGSVVGGGGGDAVSAVMGGASFVGDFSELQNYGNSIYSKAKENLIRSIAEDVLTALKAKNVKNVRNAPIQDVVAHLTKALPPSMSNPRKFHEQFNKSSAAQKEVCRALGAAINKHYAGALIDLDGDEAVMCTKIAEIMYSLLTGLHTEFMNVAGDVMRVMNNMQLANEFLERAYKKQKDLVAETGDARLRDRSNETDKVYDAIKAEYNRQNAILANLINVSVGPTGKSLIQSLEDNRDFVGTVRDLKAMVGTQAFGDKLSYLLSGISSVAHSAELIDKALKKIGMSASDFKSAKNASELRSKVFKHIMDSNPSSKKLDELMAAARIIYEANYDHASISKVLGGHSGGKGPDASQWANEGEFGPMPNYSDMGGKESSSSDSDSEPEPVMGGAGEDDMTAYWKRKSLSKKIENKKKYRDLVLKDFRKQLKQQLRQVVEAANSISRNIGNGIPITDNLKNFVDAFQQMPTLDQENIHLALSGYPRDSTSKEQRELFMYKYDSVMKAAELLVSGPQGALFKKVHEAAGAMIKLIDDFSDKMVKALTDIHIDNPAEIAASLKKASSTFYGAGDSDSGDDVFGEGSWVAFDKVKHEMQYYYSIANVKTNLARSHDDLKSYSEDYEQILGEEAAWIIDRIRRQYLNRIEKIDPTQAPPAGLTEGLTAIWRDLHDVHTGAPEPISHDGQSKSAAEWALENLKSLWAFQMNAKVNMVKAAQAVDMYMKAFTEGISQHPDSLSSIVKMLNEVEIVARWFNERSGDQLATLFDVFPSSMNGADPSYLDTKDSNVDSSGVVKIPAGNDDHYYVYVQAQNAKGNLPGNPYLGRPLVGDHTSPKQCLGVITLSQKVVKSMRALENILSAFASVGSKFGGVDPLTKTFMSPGQLFNCLCDYVAASAFTHEFAPGEEITAAVYLGGDKGATLDGATIPAANPDNHRKDSNKSEWSHNLAGARNRDICGKLTERDIRKGYVAPGDSSVADSVTAVRDADARIARTRERALAERARTRERALASRVRTGDRASAELTAARAELEAARADAVTADISAASAAPSVAVGGAEDDIARGGHGILTGVCNDNSDVVKCMSLAMSSIPSTSVGCSSVWKYHSSADTGTGEFKKMRLDMAGWRDMFFDTDLLFQMTIKSIVAKILTSVDAYRLFHRPVSDRRAHYSLNPLRTILGGAEGGALTKVKVEPEALELYYRLVLLAEWYRENFGVESSPSGVAQSTGKDSWRVTIVPTIDGIWSDLVEVVFDKAEYVKDGNYTETQCQRMILAMNDIWKSYKSKFPTSTTRGILNAFVLEMNRAFGFLRQTDIESYLADRRSNLTSQAGKYDSTENFMEYDILNAEDAFSARPAPSDRFTTTSASGVPKKNTRNMMFLQEAIEALRKKIDVGFLKVTQDDRDSKLSFKESLKHYRNDLANAKNDTEEYSVVLKMLQGANRYVNHSADKLIMVHEMVAAPLTVLYSVYKVLAQFNALCHGASLGVNPTAGNSGNPGNVSKWVAGAGAGVVNDANLPTKYAQFLTGVYNKIPGVDPTNAQIMHFASVLGKYIAPDAVVDQTNNVLAKDLLKDVLTALLDFGSNPGKLVTVSVGAAGALNIDVSALEEECRDLLSLVKENAKKLRNNFNPDDVELVDKYEEAGTVGSTRWLEENLVQKLFMDRDRSGLQVGIQHLRNTYNALCNPVVGAPGSRTVGDSTAYYTGLDQVMNELAIYDTTQAVVAACRVDITKFPGNVVALKKSADTPEEKEGVARAATGFDARNQASLDAFNNVYPMPVIVGETADTVNTFTSDGQSLMLALNKALHMYLHTGVEDGTSKFYLPMIESFATSAASIEVMQNKGVPNVVNYQSLGPGAGAPLVGGVSGAAILPPANRGLPANAVIHASNAIIIRSLMNSVVAIGTSQRKRFLFDTLTEMPEHLKDRLKVNLPFFAKIFTSIADRALLLKNLLANTGLKNNVASSVAGSARWNGVKPDSDELVDRNGRPTADNAVYYAAQLNRLYECAQSLRKCAESVYRELNDRPPTFFETGKDFLVDFRTRYGGNPVMPFSSILVGLRMRDAAKGVMLPTRENGSNVYKFNYATRLLLARDVDANMDHFAGAKELYNSYATGTSRNVLVSPNEYANTIKHTFMLAKYLMNGMSDSRLTSANSLFTWAGDKSDPAVPAHKFDILPLKDSNGLAGVIELTENNNLNISKDRLAKYVGATQTATNLDRGRMQILNILDAGIVPLNVHAFMREVPFVNLLNYSYTFDRMIHEFILPDYITNKIGSGLTTDNLMIKADDVATSTRELFVKLLVHPYANLVAGHEYFNLLGSLFNGNDNLKIGRPRYLSDQLWHKALLTSSVQVPSMNNLQVGGPQSYEVIRGVVRYNNGIPGVATNYISQSRQAVDTAGLKVWDGKAWKVATGAPMPRSDVLYCAELGKLRFDTRLSRNLVWFVHLQRIMRVVLTNHLSWLNTPVVRGLKISDSKITEFDGNDKFDEKDFTGENYSAL